MANREWMYRSWQYGKAPSNEWLEMTKQFLDCAFSLPDVAEGGTIKCPCGMCRNYFKHNRQSVELHLCKHGFRGNYEIWTSHGEKAYQ